MKLLNSYSGQIENFQPLNGKEVKMYVCGITPYDTTHLGHAFVYVTFDALKRFLEFKGYKVTYTQNVTDIDDDILKRAKRDNINWIELGNLWTEKFLNDLKALNVQMPNHYIKATEAIPEIVEMVRILIEKGVAYEANGNIYFEVSKFPNYGKLSKFSPKQMVQLLKERGGDPNDPNKKAPLDFLLWQKSAADEPFWPARNASHSDAGGDFPLGKGRPGWHIECSAMIKKTLGSQIDIHGGGLDLIYPHHESELAQSESSSGKSPFVKYWMHIAMVSYMGEKMSKSLGNLILVSDLLKQGLIGDQIRWMLLSHHYRKPWEFNDSDLERMHQYYSLNNTIAVRDIEIGLRYHYDNYEIPHNNPSLLKLLRLLKDDFNTPAVLEEIENLIYKQKDFNKDEFLAVQGILKILGFKSYQYPKFI